MKGTICVTKLGHRASVSRSDFDERLGGEFVLLIEPFYGNENERFYYARNCPDGRIELEGEAYILSGEDVAAKRRKYQKEAREKLSNNPIWYYWLDKEGNIINKVPEYPAEGGND